MKKVLILVILVLLLCGCEKEKSVESYISSNDELVSINYPVTNINVLDDAISSYVKAASQKLPFFFETHFFA